MSNEIMSRIERLYEEHHLAMLRAATRVLGDSTRAEDAVQESWLRAIVSMHTLRCEDKVGAWLTRIAANRARQIARSDRRRLAGHAKLTSEPCFGDVTNRCLATVMIDSLPPGMRRVVQLLGSGWTHREVAEQLGISPGTSKSQLYKARARLDCGRSLRKSCRLRNSV